MSLIQYAGMVMFFLVLIGGFIGLPIWNVHRRGKLQEITENKVIAIRLNRVGSIWFELCEVSEGAAKISKDGEAEQGEVLLNKVNSFTGVYPPTMHKVGKFAKFNFFSALVRPTVSAKYVVAPEDYSVGYMPWSDEEEEKYTQLLDRQLASHDDQVGEKLLRGIERSLEKTPSGGGLKKSEKTWAVIFILLLLLLSGAAAIFSYLSNTEIMSWGW